jgi:large subunit ribosomal protein L10
MASELKVAKVAEIKERLGAASSVVLADYRGLSVKDMQQLRRDLTAAGCEITIYKNRLTKIALADMDIAELDEFLIGPTAFAMTNGDPVALAKALIDFSKEHDALEVKVAYVDEALISAEDIKVLAALPSRDELIAKLMGTMLNPVRGFMAMANAPAAAFTRTLKAVADQKAAA